MKSILFALALLSLASHATASMITPDFSMLGTITQDGTPGGTNVTQLVKDDINAAIQWWENAILKDFDLSIKFTFASLTEDVGLHTLVMEDATTSFIKQSKIQFDLPSETDWFFDNDPHDNDEFAMQNFVDDDGVVVGREGSATDAAAMGNWDFLSVAKHEIGHALGLSNAGTLFTAETADGDIDIDAGLMSTLTRIPVNGSHFDGNPLGGLFDHALMGLPGFGSGERAVQSHADILAIASVYNLTKNEINLDPAHVPEPGTLSLLALGGLMLVRRRRRC